MQSEYKEKQEDAKGKLQTRGVLPYLTYTGMCRPTGS